MPLRRVALVLSAATTSIASLLLVSAAAHGDPAPLEISTASLALTVVLWLWVIAETYTARVLDAFVEDVERVETIAQIVDLHRGRGRNSNPRTMH